MQDVPSVRSMSCAAQSITRTFIDNMELFLHITQKLHEITYLLKIRCAETSSQKRPPVC